jgi:methylated-DNA-[protein]-cysteine S-methyltransferase
MKLLWTFYKENGERRMNEVFYDYYKSPIGYIELVSSETSILRCNFVEKMDTPSKNMPSILRDATKQIDRYFDSKLQDFDLKLELMGTTFQEKVWNELLKIPFGKTITYKEIAEGIGNKNAIRAVGSANGKNPISIIIPCHRVLGSKGDLRGYGGGIEKKKWLIAFEKSAIRR